MQPTVSAASTFPLMQYGAVNRNTLDCIAEWVMWYFRTKPSFIVLFDFLLKYSTFLEMSFPSR